MQTRLSSRHEPEHRGLLVIRMSSFSCLTSASNRYIGVINLLEIPRNISDERYTSLSSIISFSDFQTRFQGHNAVVMRLCCLIPKMYSSSSHYHVQQSSWVSWGGRRDLGLKGSIFSIPETALDALSVCRRDFYPNIHILLRITATLPVTTAERSFSTLKCLKTYLRSTIDQVRLTVLALLHVHREVLVSVDKVIDQFASSNRCLDFIV